MTENPQKMAKILYFITKSNWGGAQRHVFDLATNLSPKEFNVAVVVGGNGALKTRLDEYKIQTLTIEELTRDINTRKDLTSFLQFYKLLKKETPNILHMHSPKAGGIGALAGRLYNLTHREKIKIIYTVHGWTFNENRNLFSKTFIVIFSWFTVLLSDKVVVLGNQEKEQTNKWPLIKNKIIIIKNGIAKPSYLARTKLVNLFQHKLTKK